MSATFNPLQLLLPSSLSPLAGTPALSRAIVLTGGVHVRK
jgi:hypothetical protein